MTTVTETCENCGAAIGRLETAHVWRENVVCPACHQKLSAADPAPSPTPPPAPASLPYAVPVRAAPTPPPPHPTASGPYIVCANPHCGYRGPGNKVRKANIVFTVCLLLLWVVPGLIYAVIMNGYRILCPACGQHVRDES